MPRERVAMRKIREILRLVWGCNQSRRDTAKACGVGKSTVDDTINRAIAAGQVLRGDGSAQAQPLREALVSRDRKQVFRIDDGIPVLLVEEALATAQVADFPAG